MSNTRGKTDLNVKTPRGVALLLLLRRQFTNCITLTFDLRRSAEELNDAEGVAKINQLETIMRELRERYSNAMPVEHIEGVEKEKKALGLDVPQVRYADEASGRGNW